MKSILLVDDEEAVATELQRNLRQFGYKVDLAHTFETALASIGNAKFDLILAEFNLVSEHGEHARSGGGIRLVRAFRDSGITIPILIYTVMEGEMYERAALDEGADEFILKSAPLSALISRLHAHLERNDRGFGVAQSGDNMRHRPVLPYLGAKVS
jgi:DNA-binding response OmpR family regulator